MKLLKTLGKIVALSDLIYRDFMVCLFLVSNLALLMLFGITDAVSNDYENILHVIFTLLDALFKHTIILTISAPNYIS